VAAPPVAEDRDVLEQVGFSIGPGLVASPMNLLVLKAVEEALRGCVVRAVALAAHRGGHSVLGELVPHGEACVLAAAIAVGSEFVG